MCMGIGMNSLHSSEAFLTRHLKQILIASVGSSLFGGIQSVRQASAMAEGAAETSAIAYGFSGTIMAAFVMGVIGIVLAILYARKENK